MNTSAGAKSESLVQQPVKIEPLETGVLEAPVVKVVSVHVGDRSHFYNPEMTTPAGAGVAASKR